MSVPNLDREQCRAVDRRAVEEYGMSSLILMENAGRGVADKLCELGIAGPVVVCCGKGNNGGDGLVAARHLDIRRRPVRVLLFGDVNELSPDAAANYQILALTDVPLEMLAGDVTPEQIDAALAGAEWVVDALLGTGVQGEVRPPLDCVIDRMNAAPGRKLAVDVPSGLDCDTGRAAKSTFRAQHTCTFVASKPGFHTEDGPQYAGAVHVLDIGAPRKLVENVAASG